MMLRSALITGLTLALTIALSMAHPNDRALPDMTISVQAENPLALVAQIDLPAVSIGRGFGGARFIVHATTVWGDGVSKAAVAAGNLIHVLDIADPKNPFIKTFEVNGESWDLKIDGHLLYVAMNYSPDGTSLLIYDISDVKNPQFKGALKAGAFAGVHNVFVRGKVAFMASFGAAGSPEMRLTPGARAQMHLADISDPGNPVYLGAVDDPERPNSIRRIHDMTVIGNRAYLAGWNTGFWILDFENLDDPRQGVRWQVAGHGTYRSAEDSADPSSSHTHNVWPSPDGKILFTTDEVDGDYVRAWDISDPASIKLWSQFRLNEIEIAHNVVVDGSFAYIAYYTAGVHVLDYSDPTQLKEVASYDTDPRPIDAIVELFSGAWSVFPFGKHVLVGDMETGLFVFEKRGVLVNKP